MQKNMNVLEAIRHRFSVRNYQHKEIPRDVLMDILEAARLAPSAKNRQEWQFIVVTEKAKKAQLGEVALGQAFVAQAAGSITGMFWQRNYVCTVGLQGLGATDRATAKTFLTFVSNKIKKRYQK